MKIMNNEIKISNNNIIDKANCNSIRIQLFVLERKNHINKEKTKDEMIKKIKAIIEGELK